MARKKPAKPNESSRGEPLPIGFMPMLVDGGAEATFDTTAIVPCVVERLVIARESALDACTEHEDCRASWELGHACISARLPPDVHLPPGFDVISVRAAFIEYMIGGPLPASAFVGETLLPWNFTLYPGITVSIVVSNRDARPRLFSAYLACVRMRVLESLDPSVPRRGGAPLVPWREDYRSPWSYQVADPSLLAPEVADPLLRRGVGLGRLRDACIYCRGMGCSECAP